MQRNQHVRFGGGRLETQVELCAGRLPYFVILTRNKQTALDLKAIVREKLARDLLIELHDDPEKTKVSEIAAGDLEFVGFHFTKNDVRARSFNITKFKIRFNSYLQTETKYITKNNRWKKRLRIAIKYCVNPRILGLEPEFCPTCNLPIRGQRNWIAFFAQVVTREDQLRQLDRWMREQVSRYFRDHYRVRLGRKELEEAGMKSLLIEYYRLHNKKQALCKCAAVVPVLEDDDFNDIEVEDL